MPFTIGVGIFLVLSLPIYYGIYDLMADSGQFGVYGQLLIPLVIDIEVVSILAWGHWKIGGSRFGITNRRGITLVPHWRWGYHVLTHTPEDLATIQWKPDRKGVIKWVRSPFIWRIGGLCVGCVITDKTPTIQQLMYETFLPLIASRLKDLDPEIRRRAADSPARIGESAEQAVPFLIAAMDSDDSFIRRRAAQALGKLGAKAQRATTVLKRSVLLDEDREVAELARKAVAKIEASLCQ